MPSLEASVLSRILGLVGPRWERGRKRWSTGGLVMTEAMVWLVGGFLMDFRSDAFGLEVTA